VGDILQVNRLYCTGAYLVKATDTCGYVKYARSLFWHARTCYRHLVEDDEILEAVGGGVVEAQTLVKRVDLLDILLWDVE